MAGVGMFYEQCIKGNLFAFGGASTSLASTNATATGLSATATPVIGVYNPGNSGKNLIILQTSVIVTVAAASTVLPGAFTWVYAKTSVVTTGTAGIQRYLGNTNAAVGLGFAVSTALTGLVGNLTNTNIPLATGSVVTAEPATATSMFGSPWVEENEGNWIVPPGYFLGVMNTVSTTTVSVAPFMLWAESPSTGLN